MIELPQNVDAASDSRGGDGGQAATCGVIVDLPVGLCTRQPQCCQTAIAGTAVRPDALLTAPGS